MYKIQKVQKMYREKSAFYPCLLGISLAQSKHFCWFISIYVCVFKNTNGSLLLFDLYLIL